MMAKETNTEDAIPAAYRWDLPAPPESSASSNPTVKPPSCKRAKKD